MKGEWSNVKLIVYNNFRKEVKTLVNELQSAGNYEVKFNARLAERGSNLPSGIYLYRLTAGDYSET